MFFYVHSYVPQFKNLKEFVSIIDLPSVKKLKVSHYDRVYRKNDESNYSDQLDCEKLTINLKINGGGATRLTKSGLSMVSWKFFGEGIPSNEDSWLDEFDEYKKYPEFRISNQNMTIEEFKRIWWMEYVHRMWGRLLGIVFIIPASYFWIKNMLNPIVKRKLLLLGTLIGCQGLMGWYMVRSGLERKFDNPCDIPCVSQYRLATHLCLAFIIYYGLFRTALEYIIPLQNTINHQDSHKTVEIMKQLRKLRFLVNSSQGLIFFTAISGSFVAGLHAGLIYNTFPKMSNKWVPDDIGGLSPIHKNCTENPTTAQFNHRLLALLTLLNITSIGIMSWKYKFSRRISIATTVVVSAAHLQIILGASTLVNHIPVYLSVLHQFGSLLLFSATIWLGHELKYIKKIFK